ncbi:lysophospholipid acyltransferase family protein [Campylobacter estrildidarum]|uniref:GTP-binding protein n=1 Tax=Campylobacter estrildidarum TaxID=2510189 RepID=A0A4U7BNH9_9BACT|nr:lysophospholipid acyltransferase family protein [Campylobacter estrildidarum]TKX30456.1 GTP-binding protein [Campylobacter estrildidarum]
MGNSFKITLTSYLVFILQWIIFLTCKKTYRGNKLDENPYIILFWHGRLALMPFAFRYFRQKNKKAYVMISHHKDGEQIARIIKLFGLNSVRGSTSKGASGALRSAFKVLDKNDDIVITPDGPRGPYHSISDGAVLLAQKKNVKIRLLNYEAECFWEFKSWDKMILPKPFTNLIYRLSDPLDISNFDKNQAKEFLLNQLENIEKMDSFKE